MPSERLQKILAAAGVASRRGADALVAAGRVTVDGRPGKVGEVVDPDRSVIAVDGRPIGGRAEPLYFALHKPAGVTSTVEDRHAERAVLDLVPPALRKESRLYPVGRLDQDSEGLVLLTNDGDWANRVLHPRYGVEREYAIGLSQPLEHEQVRALEAGIRLDEGIAHLLHFRAATAPEIRRLVELVDPSPPPLAWYRATIRQGWKRQLRRMFGAVGAPIERLVRVRVGTLRLDDLRSGQVRPLSAAEVRSLAPARRHAAGPPSRGRPVS